MSGRRGGRKAFTMLELLIVIAIIAMLAALLTSAVTRVLHMQSRTETLHEIKKLESSLQAAMGKYDNINYLTSRLILINDINVYTLPDDAGQFTKKVSSAPYNCTPQEVSMAKQTGIVIRYMFGRRLLSKATSPGAVVV